MDATLPTISLARLLVAFLPALLLIAIMHRWSLAAGGALYASARMLLQLLAVGYVLTTVFESNEPLVIGAVILAMTIAATWIALRPVKQRGPRVFLVVLAALGGNAIAMLVLVTQIVLDMPRWFEPRFVVPLAGMILANAMNTLSLAAERFEAERDRGCDVAGSRRTALDAALIPQINGLLAVGIVSLPGMMTGQILSGVEPLVAVRYQIMVMCMIFGASGLAAASYLALQSWQARAA